MVLGQRDAVHLRHQQDFLPHGALGRETVRIAVRTAQDQIHCLGIHTGLVQEGVQLDPFPFGGPDGLPADGISYAFQRRDHPGVRALE